MSEGYSTSDFVSHTVHKEIMVPKEEFWKEHPRFVGLVEVSTQGRVRSVLYREFRSGSCRTTCVPKGIIKLGVATVGYPTVRLHDSFNHGDYFLVHRLVLETFVGFCPKGLECRHLDGNKFNNWLINLAWGTRKENMRDCVRHGTHYLLRPKPKGAASPLAKLKGEDIPKIHELYSKGYSGKEIGDLYGVDRHVITSIIAGRGYKEHQPEPNRRAKLRKPGVRSLDIIAKKIGYDKDEEEA